MCCLPLTADCADGGGGPNLEALLGRKLQLVEHHNKRLSLNVSHRRRGSWAAASQLEQLVILDAYWDGVHVRLKEIRD